MREFPKQKDYSLYLSIPKLVMKMDKGICLCVFSSFFLMDRCLSLSCFSKFQETK